MNEADREESGFEAAGLEGYGFESGETTGGGRGRYRDEVYSRRVPAGKRTYFFDVKTTRSGEDFFITITESKRVNEGQYEKHKIFLYKEDFGKFVAAMHEVVLFVQSECLPGYDFRGMPEISTPESADGQDSSSRDDEEG